MCRMNRISIGITKTKTAKYFNRDGQDIQDGYEEQNSKTGFDRHVEQGKDPVADETLAGPLEDLVIRAMARDQTADNIRLVRWSRV